MVGNKISLRQRRRELAKRQFLEWRPGAKAVFKCPLCESWVLLAVDDIGYKAMCDCLEVGGGKLVPIPQTAEDWEEQVRQWGRKHAT